MRLKVKEYNKHMSKLVVGNLKMNILSLAERERFFADFKRNLVGKKFPSSRFILCPPAIHLESFVKSLKGKGVSFGVQNLFWEEKGSFTGEISGTMAKNLGADWVIVAHSERRRYFGETDEIANLKIKTALKEGLAVIYCVGEIQAERAQGRMKEVITRQIKEGLKEVSGLKLEKIMIAYEPIWAVGTDIFHSSNEVMEARILIKKILIDKYGLKASEKVAVLYGGSVKAKYVQQLCLEPGMDGVLVGRESLVPREFIKIAEIINQ